VTSYQTGNERKTLPSVSSVGDCGAVVRVGSPFTVDLQPSTVGGLHFNIVFVMVSLVNIHQQKLSSCDCVFFFYC
jgi:hypothetical protein